MRSFSAVIAFVALWQAPAASPDLLQRALDPNPSLHSYIASATLSATLHAPVPIHKTFAGSTYYLKPRQKIVFDNVSGPLSKFKELVSAVPTFDEVRSDYAIRQLGDDGKRTSFELVPTQSGRRVTKVLVDVSDDSALIQRAVWLYQGGGRLAFEPTYETIQNFALQSGETISARFPGYSVDGKLQFGGYRLNEPIPPSIFPPTGST